MVTNTYKHTLLYHIPCARCPQAQYPPSYASIAFRMISISFSFNSFQLLLLKPFRVIPAKLIRCKEATCNPIASIIFRICRFLPSINVNSNRLLSASSLLLLDDDNDDDDDGNGGNLLIEHGRVLALVTAFFYGDDDDYNNKGMVREGEGDGK